MKLWYMNDNHTFCKLPQDVETAIEVVRKQFARGQSYGMLCATDGSGKSMGSPLDDKSVAHARGDFTEFEPRARAWHAAQVAYKSPADLEYESWTHGVRVLGEPQGEKR